MNKIILMGRLTRDPEVRYGGADNQTAIGRFSLAVDRRFRRAGDSVEADFFNCTAFGRQAEFAEKYLKQGTKILLVGRVQNDNYTNREGQKVYSVQIIAEEIEFAESKNAAANNRPQAQPAPAADNFGGAAADDGFMNIPDGVDDDDLPFN
jgi:single stranded DNA-binding protein (ssb)